MRQVIGFFSARSPSGQKSVTKIGTAQRTFQFTEVLLYRHRGSISSFPDHRDRTVEAAAWPLGHALRRYQPLACLASITKPVHQLI
jgi:hypothetical protein